MTQTTPGLGVVKTTPRRSLAASIFAAGGWIRGDFILPKLHALLQHLNSTPGFVKMGNVLLPGVQKPIEFVAFRSEAFTLIVPTEDDHVIAGAAVQRELSRHSVSCFFASGYLNATLETIGGARVSDFLQSTQRFVAFRDCTIRLSGHAPQEAPLVIVNTAQILGISQPQIG
ncbi:MAG TPA: hypothetical protein VFL80_05410 [Thermoanaerobaculia bacterium]|nr:hypothetical protein [Thermoanaerobaculia bacterium]